jgi:O-antigen/teichoic acid export membrane protein
MSEYKLFIQRVGLVGLANLFISFSGLILLPVLTKNISVNNYGIWAQVTVTIIIMPVFLTMGLNDAVVRFLPSEQKSEQRNILYSLFCIVLVISFVVSVLFYVFSDIIAASLFDGKTIIVKVLSVIIFIESLNEFMTQYFRAIQKIKIKSALDISKSLLKVGFVSFFVLSDYDIYGAIYGILISSIIIMLITFLLVFSELGIRNLKIVNVKQFLYYGLPLTIGHLSGRIVNVSDRYVIGFFLGTAFVGYYSPAYTLGDIISLFFAPLNFMLPPVLSKYYEEGNLKTVKTILSLSFKYFVVIAIPAAFGLSVMSNSILTVLSTSEIAQQGYIVTPFVAFSTLLFGVTLINSQILYLIKKTTIIANAWVIAAVFNLVLNIILIPYIGIIGAAATTSVAYLLLFAIISVYSFKFIKFNINLLFLIKCLFASFLMSFIPISLKPTGLFEITIVIIISAVIYFFILYIFKGFDKKEIYALKDMMIS